MVPFMNYLADEGAVMESSSLLVAWLDLLTGMASGPKGASTVFGSLCVDASGKPTLSLYQACRDGDRQPSKSMGYCCCCSARPKSALML